MHVLLLSRNMTSIRSRLLRLSNSASGLGLGLCGCRTGCYAVGAQLRSTNAWIRHPLAPIPPPTWIHWTCLRLWLNGLRRLKACIRTRLLVPMPKLLLLLLLRLLRLGVGSCIHVMCVCN